MTEHFTREETVALAKAAGFEVRRGLGLRESVPEDVFARGLINEEVTALCNAAVTAIDKKREAQGAVAYLAWKDGKPCYEGGDGVCEDAVWPLDDTDDRTSMPVYTHALPAQPAEPVNAELVKAPDSCLWTPDTDYETDVHYSACGEAWSFIEGGPKENNVRFCQGCGKPVVIASAQPQQKEG